jgi:hypothetical protein
MRRAVLAGAVGLLLLFVTGCSSSKESIATGKGKGRGLAPAHARPEAPHQRPQPADAR